MYFLLSPAKNLNESHEFTPKFYSTPPLLNHAAELMNTLRQLAPQQIAELMHVSDKIALLNTERNQNWQPPFTPDNAKLALYLFNGDVYDGIAPRSLAEEHISYIHNHVRILSGLYGILRPLDLMQPYRLEMGTALANPRGKNLYEFWGDIITERLNNTLQCAEDNIVINLASQEYFKAVHPQKLNARIITPVFQDEKDGKYKIISFYAKRARGLMMRYAIEHRAQTPADLLPFAAGGYAYAPEASAADRLVFRREKGM